MGMLGEIMVFYVVHVYLKIIQTNTGVIHLFKHHGSVLLGYHGILSLKTYRKYYIEKR